ncbi:DUF5304 family protein [Streptomyces sp. WMMB 322]|uniref:DUF5304 family protein n=1 Tax=Streptomyces sp. WMMB 322 TaxID=1286821 RepID=UPI000823C3A5|nr:DUF5304 family protein [Streptomyces sp. WMMB 322]SCK24879.1 hypothetical protein H180DRAFT_01896 [Streptomyces sp. WMMB 322]
MSDAAEPEMPDAADADAWATACEEDLAAEKARRRAEYGQSHGSAAEELRRLADAVSDRVAELGRPFGGTMASAAAQGMAQQFIAQARAAIEPVVERNPHVFDHLAAAGGELLAAYRAAVQEAEGRWTAGTAGASGTGDRAGRPGDSAPGASRPSGPPGVERIDLDKEPGGTGTAQDPGPAEEDGPDGHGTGSDGPGAP